MYEGIKRRIYLGCLRSSKEGSIEGVKWDGWIDVEDRGVRLYRVLGRILLYFFLWNIVN